MFFLFLPLSLSLSPLCLCASLTLSILIPCTQVYCEKSHLFVVFFWFVASFRLVPLIEYSAHFYSECDANYSSFIRQNTKTPIQFSIASKLKLARYLHYSESAAMTTTIKIVYRRMRTQKKQRQEKTDLIRSEIITSTVDEFDVKTHKTI